MSDNGGAPLTEEALARAMSNVRRFQKPQDIILSPKAFAARLRGDHPLYPPDDHALMDHWREVAERFWAGKEGEADIPPM